MKFKIREGFVVELVKVIELPDESKQIQRNTLFGGQEVELDKTDADLHIHKLEPVDAPAKKYLDSKVLPASPAASIGVTPETLALAKAIASEVVSQVMTAVQASAPAAPAAPAA